MVVRLASGTFNYQNSHIFHINTEYLDTVKIPRVIPMIILNKFLATFFILLTYSFSISTPGHSHVIDTYLDTGLEIKIRTLPAQWSEDRITIFEVFKSKSKNHLKA